ncbi:UvrD-helicase domain-containing protein [Streptomyces sp. NPDC085946]|uniref:UvrD-helicase domain-containing protein n=1 Tax=Streptomyces sp. NPDC085946 TaxID=3365744 RepID=UPI0037CCD9FB
MEEGTAVTITPVVGHMLTPAQQLVVDQPWDARTLVTAGAGAGKTTTLTHRLEALTGREELEAAEILMLSFSRAAVRELRQRIDRHARIARRVRAQTFDSWAAALLHQAYPDRDLSDTTFDQRIEMATDAVDQGAVEATEQGVPAHVIIDEVQDLVGVRREMTEALLDRFKDNCGFTVVGDAAQAVYGFQVSDPEQRSGETNRFFDWVRASFGEDLVEVVLDHNFRARTPEARVALPYGARIQSLPTAPDEAAEEAERIHADLRAELLSAPEFGDFEDTFVRDSLRDFDGTTAILCRDNGQVLHLSEKLHAAGVEHRLQRSPKERPAHAWLAGLISATEAVSFTEDRFAELVANLDLTEGTTAAQAWRSLRRAAAGPRNTLNIEKLHQAIAQGSLPDEITAAPNHPLVLSTVHRAKGLEFDRVLIVEPEPLVAPRARGRQRDYDPAAEVRLLYVAMTRPRDDIFRLARPNTWYLRKHTSVDRWYIGGREKYKRDGIEARDQDVCHEFPAGVREPEADPVQTQRYLAEVVRPNDPVELRRLHDLPMDSEQAPPYGIFHNGRSIGEVSERFRKDLWRLLKISRTWEVNLPFRIIGLRVEGLETVAGTTAVTERAKLGTSGVWLAPRLSGLGRFDRRREKTASEGLTHS